MSSGLIDKNISSDTLKDDIGTDNILRPMSFGEYIGQEAVKKNVDMIIKAAKKRKEPIDHLLFYGPAGLGKTTLANLVAKEMGCGIKVTSGPVVEKTGDLAAILSNLEEGDILFIDEAHRINRMIEEMLYPAMESRKLHLVLGKGPGARMISIDLPPFTLIAATTRINLLSSPLRSRFGGIFKLDYYNTEDIEKIIERSAKILKVKINYEAIKIIARASRFTPRLANRLLKRVRDLSEVNGESEVSLPSALETLKMFEIDNLGLEEHDRKLLKIIVEKFGGGPVGLSSLAAALGEDKDTIEEVYEPYLIKMGLIMRTAAGRVTNDITREHLTSTGCL